VGAGANSDQVENDAIANAGLEFQRFLAEDDSKQSGDAKESV
jgi:hypothetical protein